MTPLASLDGALFHWINHWPEALAPWFRFLSEGNKEPVVRALLACVVVLFIVKGGRWRAAAILAVLAWLISNETCDLLKEGLRMPRPCADPVEPDLILRVKRLTSFGTASAHSASMAAVASVFTALLGRWGWPWIALAFGVGLSRAYVGVHYPSQILLGWAVGAAFGLLAVWVYRRWIAPPLVLQSETEGGAGVGDTGATVHQPMT